MLKKSLFVIVLLFFSSTLFANEENEEKDKVFYLKAGYGVSFGNNVYEDAMPQPIAVWNLGLAFEYYPIKELTSSIPLDISFNAELLYEKQPISYKTDYDVKMNFNFTYITIPVGLRIIFSDFFLIGSGLYYAKTLKSNSTLDSVPVGPLVDVKDDIGLFVDLGLKFNMFETNSLMLYIRPKLGFVELEKYNKVKTQAITFNAAYGFKF